jgi:hypothetical protein
MATEIRTAPSLDVRRLRETLGLSRERMAWLFGVTGKTIERWESKAGLPTGDPIRMERLAAVQEIAELGTTVYTPDGFVRFLQLPLPVFGGQSALQLIARGDTETVLGALASDYEGVGY